MSSNIYRIFPVLWESYTVYGIDRKPSVIQTVCSTRVKEDPAYAWAGSTYQRLVPPPPQFTNGNSSMFEIQAITWNTLPTWLSYAQSVGYTINNDFSKLKPYSDIYITGP
jgi:hypothetical protein